MHSVRDIAAAAGVSVGTVAHLGDKATLFLDVMEENAFALVGGALERLSGEPVGTSPTLAAEIWGVFEPSLTRIIDNPAVTRAYLIAYLRAEGGHATSAGQVDVICAGLAARCVLHSGGDPALPRLCLRQVLSTQSSSLSRSPLRAALGQPVRWRRCCAI